MTRSSQANKHSNDPPVFRFKARLSRNPNSANGGSATQLDIPKGVSKRLRDMTTVEGAINGHPFRAVLQPNPSGGHWLRVNEAMRRGARADAGDTVQLAILGPEPEPKIPADLRVAFAASVEAQTLWKELTPLGRLDWIRWISSAKTPETRAHRIKRTVEQLAEGKRRPCCVNVYEFMLCRIQE